METLKDRLTGKKKVEVLIDKKLNNALESYSNAYGGSKNQAVSKALRMYFTEKMKEEADVKANPNKENYLEPERTSQLIY